MDLDLELDKAVSAIKKSKPNTVCIQLPDGLKPKAGEIKDFLEKETSAQVLIWFGSCYGACDRPDVKGVDMTICFGHSEWG